MSRIAPAAVFFVVAGLVPRPVIAVGVLDGIYEAIKALRQIRIQYVGRETRKTSRGVR